MRQTAPEGSAIAPLPRETPARGVARPVTPASSAPPAASEAAPQSSAHPAQLAAARAAAARTTSPPRAKRPALADPDAPPAGSSTARALFSQSSPPLVEPSAGDADEPKPLLRRLLSLTGRLIGKEPEPEPQLGRFAISPDGRFYTAGQGAIPDDAEPLKPVRRDAETPSSMPAAKRKGGTKR